MFCCNTTYLIPHSCSHETQKKAKSLLAIAGLWRGKIVDNKDVLVSASK